MAGQDQDAVAILTAAGVPTPDVDVRWLRSAFGHDHAAFSSALARRASREPLQLILGTAAFRYLEIDVQPGVFIPRPETEVLAGLAIDRVPAGGVVVEPCTGTGAVACAIAHEGDPARVVATDIDAAAVVLARRNAAAFPAVEVVHANLFAGVDPSLLGGVDVVVCNPPYLDPQQMAEAEPEVRDHDPHLALVGGASGWEVIADLVAAAPYWVRPGGWVLLEDDPSRVDQTVIALEHHVGPAAAVADLTGRKRFAVARRR